MAACVGRVSERPERVGCGLGRVYVRRRVRVHRHGTIDLDAAHRLDRLHPLVEFHGCYRAVVLLLGGHFRGAVVYVSAEHTMRGCAHTGIMHAGHKMRARSTPASVPMRA